MWKEFFGNFIVTGQEGQRETKGGVYKWMAKEGGAAISKRQKTAEN